MGTKKVRRTWAELEGKIASEIYQAPKTCGDRHSPVALWGKTTLNGGRG